MEQWLRITLVAVAVTGAFTAGIVFEARVQDAMVRAARGVWTRALLVVVGYYLAMVLAALVVGGVASACYRSGHLAATIVVLALGLMLVPPFALIYLPASPYGPPTARIDLERRGADPKVAAAIAWPAAVLSIAIGLSIGIVFGILSLTLDGE